MTTTETPAAGMTPLPAAGSSWQLKGLCNQTDPDAFFPNQGSSSAQAKAICVACPVRVSCLEYAITRNERFGVWGGLTENERRQLRRKAADRADPIAESQPVMRQRTSVGPSNGGGFPPAACGTEAAHRRHKRRGEPVDEACAAAHVAYLDATREDRRTWRRRSRARFRVQREPRVLAPCGTPAAYSRHNRHGEKACDACRLAHNEARRMYAQKQVTALGSASEAA